AGVSTFRLMRTLLVGACIVNGLIVLNQELVIPRIAIHLQFDAGHQDEVTGEIEPVTDFATDMQIMGKRLNLKDRKIEGAQFLLTTTKLAEKLTTIRAREAIPQDHHPHQRIGWLLKGVSIPYDALQLTEMGRKYIRRGGESDELFIRTDVGIDRLYNQDSQYEYLPTWALMHRLRNPSFSSRSLRSQNLFLPARLMKPLLHLVLVAAALP